MKTKNLSLFDKICKCYKEDKSQDEDDSLEKSLDVTPQV